MSTEQELFQKARRISKAIQEYLEETGQDDLRSTDVYPYLARKGLVEKDRHNGLQFRKFLSELKRRDLLNMIPQCRAEERGGVMTNWYFSRVSTKPASSKGPAAQVHVPEHSKEEREALLARFSTRAEDLPKREADWTPQELETRRNYPRAYEYWSSEEELLVEEMLVAKLSAEDMAKVLRRQPSAVKRKIES